MVSENIEPFYFGEAEKSLFGCFHAPQSEPARDCGIVLCCPMGHEYILFHRAYRRLAVLLSRLGFPVLRFDFYGCGDSAGESREGGIQQWFVDIDAAIDEMKQRCPSANICLIGLRLGGSLSMTAGANRGDINSIVLWDPVVSGKAYLENLVALHRKMLRIAHVKQKEKTIGSEPSEILGFPITDSMCSDITEVNLISIPKKPANNILIVQSSEADDQQRLRKHLENMGTHVKFLHFPMPEIWTWIEDFGKVLVPIRILESVVMWISKVYP